jgi:anti-sigma B factor antagonist
VKPLALEGPAASETLRVFRRELEEWLAGAGWKETASRPLCLAVHEALANILEHCPTERLRVTAEVRGSEAAVRVHDLCGSGDLDKLPSRPPDELRPKGLGMHFIRQSVDGVAFEPTPDGRLTLVLTKRVLVVGGEDVDGARVIRLRGDLDLETAPRLREQLLGALERRPRAVVLDFGGLHYIDSAGVAVLVEGYLKGKKTKVPYRLAALEETARGILEMARLLQVFEVRASVEAALRG